MNSVRNILTSHKCLLATRISNGCVCGHFHRCNSSGLTEPDPDTFTVRTVEDVYERWLENPASVGNSWNAFFRRVKQAKPSHDDQSQGNDGLRGSNYRYHERGPGVSGADSKAVDDSLLVQELIRSYQLRGHYLANLDPLELSKMLARPPYVVSETAPFKHIREDHVNLLQQVQNEVNSDQVFKLPSDTFIGGNDFQLPLKDIIKRLEETYCRSWGIEYGHLVSASRANWLKQKFEVPGVTKLSTDLRRLTLARLIRTTGFENFLNKKYPSVKRFTAAGAEIIIPCLKQIIDRSTEHGVECFVITMAHRARINVMSNVCRLGLARIYEQFQDLDVNDPQEGDAKYHLGLCLDQLNKVTNKNIRVVMMANPSHLECSASLGQGRARAEQLLRNDLKGNKVMSIAIHGDAAMCGQGVTYETINMTDLPGFTTYGVIHLVLNNQLGFTTLPRYGRSSSYCTDVGKNVHGPVIHVNGNDPDAVMHAANVASDWRAAYKRDFYLDVVVFRRLGHNEGDEPMITQPIMYTKIHQMKPVAELYEEKLINEGIVKKNETEEVVKRYEKVCDEAFAEAKKTTIFNPLDFCDSPWKGFHEKQKQEILPTGVAEDILLQVANVHASPPPKDFIYHKSLDRVFNGRKDLIKHKLFDWALAEACAIGCLLKEGHHVRLTGQESERGTFSHRHYVIHHQTMDGRSYTPLANISPDQGLFTPFNSPLSEYAVLGFEFGYSQASPDHLCIWDAQFGDFQNTAQCLIDCFICCSQAKWEKQSGLVMNLPHGLDGMGPDHSSARPERFLHQCADDPNIAPTGSDAELNQLRACNWIVAEVTTPANMFHILRRQLKLPFRKPLINYYPKSLIRFPGSRSPIDDFKAGTTFKRLIPDPVDPAGVKKVVFSCGKVFYDFLKARKLKKLENEIALVRIEQVNPFPYDLALAEIKKYPNAKFCFGQEEHINQGFHHFVMPRLQKILPGKEIKLITRGAAAAGAAGFTKTHFRQLKKLLEDFINA